MKCTACGFTVPLTKAASSGCMVCGEHMRHQTDDFLLHGANGIVREMRPGQVEMGRLTERVIEQRALAVVEGPVGIGKSFAYSIPAILSGKRVVISTAKKQLQHQLAQKDLPFLADRLGKSVTVSLLKGKSNYACWVQGTALPDDERKWFFDWLSESKSGDIADLPGKKPLYWSDVNAENCIGKRCSRAESCQYFQAKTRAKTANIVVANHHVVAWDLKLGPRKLLGDYDVLIIDEAHQAIGAFRGAYTTTVSPSAAKRIINMIDRTGFTTDLAPKIDDAWKTMFNRVSRLDGEIPPDPFGSAGEQATEILTELRGAVKVALADLGIKDEKRDPYTDYDPDGDYPERAPQKLSQAALDSILELEMLQRTIDRPLDALKMAKDPGDNTVVYVETSTTGNRKSKSVNIAPVNMGPLVGPKLQMLDAVIVTSATIAVNRNFDDIKNQLGLTIPLRAPGAVSSTPPRAVEELVLETPFDYSKQALLYTPKHMLMPVAGGDFASPERVKYISTLARECKRLIASSNGNAFILFTATTDMRDVAAALAEEQLPNKLIMQEDDAEATFREFMATKYSVVLGLKSFWEGVDVVGDKLRLVIMTKFPFPQVTDPVILARARSIKKDALARGMSEQSAEGAVFRGLQLPMMFTDLRQGAGRLIRSKTDRGVLAILDPRIWTGSGKRLPSETQERYAGYGQQAADAIGFSNQTADFSFVDRYFAKLRREEKL